MKLKLFRTFFWTLWFFVIPVALTLLTIWLLDGGEQAIPEGLFGSFRYFVQNQKVPAMIVFFVLYELPFYQMRYSLPFVERLGIVGRPGLPKEKREEFEAAVQLLDDTRRTLVANRDKLRESCTEEELKALDDGVSELRSALESEQFSVEAFDLAVSNLEKLVERHLSKYQKGEAREYGESIFVAVAIALALRAFLVEAFQIPSGSMLPTLQIRDHIFVNKFVYGPKIPFSEKRFFENLPPDYGDVLVFQYPFPPGVDYIKRTIALPGDTLEVEKGHPIINGWRVPNCLVGQYTYTNDQDGFTERGVAIQSHAELFMEFLGDVSYLTMYENGQRDTTQGPYHVKQGEFWVLGDNRNNSQDSRAWRNGLGAGVPFANVRGRAMFVWLAFNRTGNDFLGVTWDRLLTNVLGKPRLPKEAAEELKSGIERCLKTRPAQTRPPAPSAVATHEAR